MDMNISQSPSCNHLIIVQTENYEIFKLLINYLLAHSSQLIAHSSKLHSKLSQVMIQMFILQLVPLFCGELAKERVSFFRQTLWSALVKALN